jgi:hypothetical protein
MRDLKVRFRQSRQCWVINATRVGLSNTHGGFRTKPEAEAEAEKLKAQFVLGQDVEAKAKPKLFSVRDALDDYQANQELLQTKSYFEAQKFNLRRHPVAQAQQKRCARAQSAARFYCLAAN